MKKKRIKNLRFDFLAMYYMLQQYHVQVQLSPWEKHHLFLRGLSTYLNDVLMDYQTAEHCQDCINHSFPTGWGRFSKKVFCMDITTGAKVVAASAKSCNILAAFFTLTPSVLLPMKLKTFWICFNCLIYIFSEEQNSLYNVWTTIEIKSMSQ